MTLYIVRLADFAAQQMLGEEYTYHQACEEADAGMWDGTEIGRQIEKMRAIVERAIGAHG